MLLSSFPASPRPFSRYWLFLAVTALALAGAFSLIPVVMHLPGVHLLFPWKTALVVHVNLSVLVWMLSIISLSWSMLPVNRQLPLLEPFALGLATLGMFALALSPFVGKGTPLTNNYVPILVNDLFFLGLALFASGVMFQAVNSLLQWRPGDLLNFGLAGVAVIVLISCAAIGASHHQLTAILPTTSLTIDLQHYYELLFWGGGHLLQFAYTQCAVLVWLILAEACGYRISIAPRTLGFLLALNIIFTLLAPWGYLNSPIDDPAHVLFFTELMRWGNGLLPLVAGGCVALAAWRAKTTPSSALKITLGWSIFLFGAGGILGYVLHLGNLTVPAHYHGSIVGITLAFTGFVYWLLPRFGYADVSRWKLARTQAMLYGIGQLMHISGLAISGGYGALRKTPGVDASVEAKAALGVMMLGGTLAIIGGVLFIVVVAKAISRPAKTA